MPIQVQLKLYELVMFSLSKSLDFFCELHDTRKMNPPAFHNRIRKVCTLVAATLILPALAYAQNNQGDEGRGFKLGVPNGTYVFQDSGYVPPTLGATTLVPLEAAGRLTFFDNGTTSGLVSFSIGGTVFFHVRLKGTFTVNANGSVSETETQLDSPGLTLHFDDYPTPDGNTITFVATDPGTIVSGFDTRGR
jgi:hypothetical protein